MWKVGGRNRREKMRAEHQPPPFSPPSEPITPQTLSCGFPPGSGAGASSSNWTQAEALELCRKIELVCPQFGCHVALTGGLLYKKGERKDCDILFYRIRQRSEIDIEPMFDALRELVGLNKFNGFGWCYKATYNGKPVDCFFPEEQGGAEYST